MRHCVAIGILVVLIGCQKDQVERPLIQVSENHRYFQTTHGDPFFWLGDTGWLLFHKLNREEGTQYLKDRKAKGFNVIQVMLIHSLNATNAYGDSALYATQLVRQQVTDGDDPNDAYAYDYWDHVEYLIDEAAKLGLHMALVPIWGSPVSHDEVSAADAHAYAIFLAHRFGSKDNIIWLNGGDIRGDNHRDIWNVIGHTLDSLDNNHLITFHPRGRTSSSEWFHSSSWLDFNMFQSGHRNYEQDTARDSHRYGPDNWRYVANDYGLTPSKPTLDGEPSYEGIPQGLHDTTQLYWNASDVRRYAYWSVFSGAAGFTYGNNPIIQFYREGDAEVSYGPKKNWTEALQDEGAQQMHHLKDLMLSLPYFERIPDQGLIGNQGDHYAYLVATKGKTYALVYTYTGRPILVNMGRTEGDQVEASWYNPRNGETSLLGTYPNTGQQTFDPPGEEEEGNDWVLLLKKR